LSWHQQLLYEDDRTYRFAALTDFVALLFDSTPEILLQLAKIFLSVFTVSGNIFSAHFFFLLTAFTRRGLPAG
jgi:hypothetical protein